MKTASKLAPSLLSASTASADNAPEMRILATLEGETEGAARKKTGVSTRRKSLYACLAITLILALAYLVLQGVTASRSVPAPVTVASTVPDLPPAQVSSTLATDTLDPAPAAIVEAKEVSTHQASVPDVAPPPKPGHTPMQIFESTTPTDATPADATPPDPAPVMPKKATAATSTTRARPAPVHKREVRPPTSGASVKNSPTPAAPLVKPRDTDVDLLAALVAHTRQGTTASPSTKPSHSPTSPIAPADNTVSTSATPLRQVVVRSAVASTAELVKQCAELGWLEGWLCKRRICDSLWGRDPACSNSNAMSSTQ